MNNRIYLYGGTSFIFVLGAIGYYAYTTFTKPVIPAPQETKIIVTTPSEEKFLAPATPAPSSEFISISAPIPYDIVRSPLNIIGRARGMWYFEGSFPVELRSVDGKTLLGTSVATATGEWMTEGFVPFNSTLTWASTTATSGILIFKRDNPSGLPENDKSLSFPVMFK